MDDNKPVTLAEFNDVVTTAMAVAVAANWQHVNHPQSAEFMERVIVGAIVSYVMKRFDIKRE